MADPQDLTNHRRQASRTGLRLFGFCLFVALTLAACGSDGGDGDETSAGAESETDDAAEGTDDDSQSAETESSDADSSDTEESASDSAESESSESTTTTPTEGSTTSSSTDAPDTTVGAETATTVDKIDLLADPDETKPTVAPPTTVSESGGDPLVDQVVGMSESAAIDLIRSTGRKVRVERRDGEEFMLTQDFEPDRLNLTVVNDSVTGVRLG